VVCSKGWILYIILKGIIWGPKTLRVLEKAVCKTTIQNTDAFFDVYISGSRSIE